jgi:hypothetical protein
MELVENRYRLEHPHALPLCPIGVGQPIFDVIQLPDPSQRIMRQRMRRHRARLVEFAPRMRPAAQVDKSTGRFLD